MDPPPIDRDPTPSHTRPEELASRPRTAGIYAVAGLTVVHAVLLLQLMHRAMAATLDSEEGFPAFVATELLAPSGPREPFTTYVYEQYQAGTMFVGWLAVVPFAIFGPTLFALKLVGVSISIATVWAVAWLAWRFYGPRAAVAAGALIALGPAPWLVRGVQTLGDTTELLPLLLVAGALVDRAIARPTAARGAAAGLAAGAAQAFSLAALPGLAVAGALWGCVAVRRGGHRRALAGAAVGVVLGLAVPLYNYYAYELEFFRWRGHGLGSMVEDPCGWGTVALEIMSEPVQRGLLMGLEPAIPGVGAATAVLWLHRAYWAAAFIAALGVGGRALLRRDARDLALALAFSAYVAAYVVNPHRVPYLLLIPVPLGAILVARAAQLAARTFRARALGATLIALVAAAELAPLVPLVALDETSEDAPLYDLDPSDAARWRWRLAPFGERFYAWLPELEAEPATILTTPADEQWGVGHLLGQQPASDDLVSRVAAAAIRGGDLDLVQRLGEGYGYAHGYPSVEPAMSPAELARLLPRPLALAAIHGAARALAERRWLELEQALGELARPLAPEERYALMLGFGYGYGMRFWHQPRRYKRLEAAFPAAEWTAFHEGLARRLRELVPERDRQAALLGLVARPRPRIAPILIAARRAAATNLNVDEHEFGAELVVDGGERPAWARYEVVVAHAGRYALWLQYATDDERPVGAWLDDVARIPSRALPISGGYHAQQLRWAELGTLDLSTGRHALELRSEGLFPHLAALRLDRLE